MELKDERRIAASREVVFAALNDPEVLRKCIPGCESLDKLSDTEMKATVALRIGPVTARFQGRVELSNIDPPSGYTIMGEGSGGPAGAARGGADVKLVADGSATILQYDVRAEVVGKLAQLGGRLIDSTAKMLAGQFFTAFAAAVESATPATATPGPVAATAITTASRPAAPAWVMLGAIAVVIIAVVIAWPYFVRGS